MRLEPAAVIANAVSRDQVLYRGVDPVMEYVEGSLIYDHYLQLLHMGVMVKGKFHRRLTP
jgi:hypothetical protein